MMTEDQLISHLWLSRTWDIDSEIRSYENRKERIIASMSGIGKYDANFIPANTGENTTETKNIEYSLLCEKIEKKSRELSEENIRTMSIIDKVSEPIIRGMLFDRYINRMSWRSIGAKYYYKQRQSYNYMHKCLDKIRPYIPKGEVKL